MALCDRAHSPRQCRECCLSLRNLDLDRIVTCIVPRHADNRTEHVQYHIAQKPELEIWWKPEKRTRSYRLPI